MVTRNFGKTCSLSYRDNLTKVSCSSNFHWPFVLYSRLHSQDMNGVLALLQFRRYCLQPRDQFLALASDLGHRIIWKANIRLGLHRWQELNALHLVYREIRYLLTFPSPWDNLRKWNFNAEHLNCYFNNKNKKHFTSGNILFFEVNFKNVDRILIVLVLKIHVYNSCFGERFDPCALARSFLSLVKSLSLLFTVGILKNETLGVFLLLLQPKKLQFSPSIALYNRL